MMTERGFCHRRIALLGACATLALLPAVARAQDARPIRIEMRAQDLGTALTDLARQTNREIYFSSDLTRGKVAPGVRGAFGVEQALQRLLVNSNLAYRINASGSIVVERAGNDAADQRDAVTAPPATLADTQADVRPDVPAEQAEIVVTGSRLARNSFNAPTPVNVVGQDRVQNLNLTSVGDALNQIPSFRPLTSPGTNTFRASQNIAARTLDLRGLGPTRTLTLIDGKRTVPSGDDGTFDLNAIPSIMVQRSEVVTGGASAAYGADAVAGVVNLILNTRLRGLKADVNYGVSQRGDAQNLYAGLAAGTDFAGGRGHFVIGGEYNDEKGVGDFNQRRWSSRYRFFVPNPFFSTVPSQSNGLPATVASDGTKYVLNPGGLISIVHPLQGTQFDANGNLVPFQFGALFNRARPSTLMVGGDASIRDIYGFLAPLVVATWHASVLGNVDYEISDAITLSAGLSWAKVSGGPSYGSPWSDQNGAIRINRDNPYLTPATAAMMDAARTTFLPVTRANLELGTSYNVSRNQTWRGFAALKGKLGGNWSWDAFYDYGRTAGRLVTGNQRITSRWAQAIDAVRVTAANVGTSGLAIGSIVCRSTLTAPTNGCVPANVMGENKVSPAVRAWVNVDGFQTREYVQHHVAANLRGTLFEGWAGDISIAAGAEYRVNTSQGDADAFSLANAFATVNASLLPKITQKVTEGYAEVNVPIFKDFALGKSLEVDGAIRRTHYSLSGNATTWKVGAVYELNDEYMLRVTRSHDIRAPSALELNPNTRTQQLSFSDPKYNVQYPIQSTTGGNPNLELERANTLTIGAVFKPEWLPRFRLSVDYYDIRVKGAIDLIGPTLAVGLCRAGTVPGICRIGTDPATGAADRILQLFATYQNVNRLRARGLEGVINYSLDLLGGRLDLAANGNYVDTLLTTLPDGTFREFADVTGNATSATTLFGVPKWRADAVVTYERPDWSVTTQFAYVPPAILSRDFIGPDDPAYSVYLPNSVNNNRVAGRLYVNLNARLKLFTDGTHKVEMFGSVNNLFDKDPPSNLRISGNPVYFDPIGRAFRMGLRAEW